MYEDVGNPIRSRPGSGVLSGMGVFPPQAQIWIKIHGYTCLFDEIDIYLESLFVEVCR
jgi:hypothetical protein